MFKITLYDYNCTPIADGTALFFIEDIEDFQKRWFSLEKDEGRKQRFLDSKNGKIVVDYYSNDPTLNIVQEDKDAKIYSEKNVEFDKKKFTVYNAYCWGTELYADKMKIDFKWIRFNGEYFRIAKYELKGVCEKSMYFKDYCYAYCYGNPILERVDCFSGTDRPKEEFKDNELKSICYVTSWWFDDEKELLEDIKKFEPNDEVLDTVFKDIVGEAG